MAVMEINLPSGYQVDEEQVKILTSVVPELQRVDVENDNTKLILYFDKVKKELAAGSRHLTQFYPYCS